SSRWSTGADSTCPTPPPRRPSPASRRSRRRRSRPCGDRGLAPRHSPLMPAALITGPHLSWSVLISFSNSSGEPPTGAAPILSNRSPTASTCPASAVSLASLALIPAGNPAGATKPHHTPVSQPNRPVSATVCTSGNTGDPAAPVTASRRRVPAWTRPLAPRLLFTDLVILPPGRAV